MHRVSYTAAFGALFGQIHRSLAMAVAIVGLLVAGVAGAQSESLDSVDTGQSESLDSVTQATAGTPDGALLEDSESLSQVPAASAEGLSMDDQDPSLSLDAASVADTRAPDNDGLVWSPTNCSELPSPRLSYPHSSDTQEWQAAFSQSKHRAALQKERVDAATEAFSGSLNRGTRMPSTRVGFGEERDAARKAYSEALCEMPALLEAARRAGVEPGVLRQFE
jgi:hypothetical protein